jgi:hypothetical protein
MWRRTPGLKTAGTSSPSTLQACWSTRTTYRDVVHTDKKEKKIFLIYKEIHMGAVAKPYMRKGFPIYEEMRKYLVIYKEAVMTLRPLPSGFPYI